MPKTSHSKSSDRGDASSSGRSSKAFDSAWYVAGMMLRASRENAAGKISALAEAARDYSKSVALPHMQDYVTFAAESLEGLSDYVAETEIEDMLEEANHFARRHPWAVIGTGLASGVLAAQIMRVNFSDRSHSMRRPAGRRRQARKTGRSQAVRKSNGKAQASA